MTENSFLLDEYLKKRLSDPPKLEFGLAPNFAKHNISPDGLIETEEWSESRNYVTTILEQSGVTFQS